MVYIASILCKALGNRIEFCTAERFQKSMELIPFGSRPEDVCKKVKLETMSLGMSLLGSTKMYSTSN